MVTTKMTLDAIKARPSKRNRSKIAFDGKIYLVRVFVDVHRKAGGGRHGVSDE